VSNSDPAFARSVNIAAQLPNRDHEFEIIEAVARKTA
jgi:hypothetical protein